MKVLFVRHAARKATYELLSWDHREPRHALAMLHRKQYSKPRKFRVFMFRLPFWRYVNAPFAPDTIVAGTTALQQTMPHTIPHHMFHIK